MVIQSLNEVGLWWLNVINENIGFGNEEKRMMRIWGLEKKNEGVLVELGVCVGVIDLLGFWAWFTSFSPSIPTPIYNRLTNLKLRFSLESVPKFF